VAESRSPEKLKSAMDTKIFKGRPFEGSGKSPSNPTDKTKR
jgi:hypothetical protein